MSCALSIAWLIVDLQSFDQQAQQFAQTTSKWVIEHVDAVTYTFVSSGGYFRW